MQKWRKFERKLRGYNEQSRETPYERIKIRFYYTQYKLQENHSPNKYINQRFKVTPATYTKVPIECRHFNILLPIISKLSELTVLHLVTNIQKISPNSLIDQNYFNFAIPGFRHLHEDHFTQFHDYCKDFKFCNQNLQYLIFETSIKLMFDCRNKIELIEAYPPHVYTIIIM